MRYQINFASYDREKQLRDRYIKMGAITVMLILVIVLGLGLKRAGELFGEHSRVKESSMKLSKKMDQLMTERKKFISDEEISVIESKLNFYRSIISSRLFATVFLNVIESKTPGYMTYKSLDFDSSRKNFILIGESLNPEAAAKLVPNLQDSSIIFNVDITRQNIQKIGEKKLLVTDFEIRGEVF